MAMARFIHQPKYILENLLFSIKKYLSQNKPGVAVSLLAANVLAKASEGMTPGTVAICRYGE
jgi:hypothetical protein